MDGELRTDSYGHAIHKAYSQGELEEIAKTDNDAQMQEFLDKKFQILVQKKMSSANLEHLEKEVQMEYMKNRIQHLNKKYEGKPNQEMRVTSLAKNANGKTCQLENARNVERLKVNNILSKVNKNNDVPVHQPQKCEQCRQLQGKLTEESFIRKKTEMLQKQQFEKDFEKHLYEKDSATLIANIINSGPKLSDPPQDIWDRLLRKGQ